MTTTEEVKAKDRIKKARSRLIEMGAKCLHSSGLEAKTAATDAVQFWQLGGKVFVLTSSEKFGGWELYVPATDSAKVEDAFAALAEWAK